MVKMLCHLAQTPVDENYSLNESNPSCMSITAVLPKGKTAFSCK